MSGRFVAVCALGLAGSLFLGYCVYFDRNRRMDPDYKKKVLARRRRAKAQGKIIDLRDPRVREEFLIAEMTAANQKMMEGTAVPLFRPQNTTPIHREH
ncbi:Mitochondrial import receptor subunit TOM20 homolog [Geodia barretti]|uniref:Mitochondrial import receptor subunit TOM20 homolog n=1 Tax=Geodia barretti TaxID=519541 RepID=A0AA35XAX3_GEOBA|nr:Mitochondrial import receptor subunit TOM20 homolog [Geodia barretti]